MIRSACNKHVRSMEELIIITDCKNDRMTGKKGVRRLLAVKIVPALIGLEGRRYVTGRNDG